ncbi:hypothetical protein ACP275_13G045500 [Erythranthe tilingii]
MAELDRLATSQVSLEDAHFFNTILFNAAISFEEAYGLQTSYFTVKSQFILLPKRFQEFKEYINLPGVSYNSANNKVTIDATYVSNLAQPNAYRVCGFPYYETCFKVFDGKRAAAINFGDVRGLSPILPLQQESIDDEDEEDSLPNCDFYSQNEEIDIDWTNMGHDNDDGANGKKKV